MLEQHEEKSGGRNRLTRKALKHLEHRDDLSQASEVSHVSGYSLRPKPNRVMVTNPVGRQGVYTNDHLSCSQPNPERRVKKQHKHEDSASQYSDISRGGRARAVRDDVSEYSDVSRGFGSYATRTFDKVARANLDAMVTRSNYHRLTKGNAKVQ